LKEGENSLNNKEVLVKDIVSYIDDFIENILGWDMNDEDYYGDFGNELEIFVRGIVFEISNEFSLWKSMNNGSVIGTDDLKGKLDRMYNVFPCLPPDYKF